jgi:hypothetical protein
MKEIKNMQLPSFPLAGERVVERSDDRVSQPAVQYRQCISANVLRSTHPDGPVRTGLVDPLFACGGKRVTATT